jgi:hypothetical protein
MKTLCVVAAATLLLGFSTAADDSDAVAKDQVAAKTLGVRINPQKTRVVHVNHGFEFLGFKIKRGGQAAREAWRYHPRQEPDAGKPHVRIRAGGGS